MFKHYDDLRLEPPIFKIVTDGLPESLTLYNISGGTIARHKLGIVIVASDDFPAALHDPIIFALLNLLQVATKSRKKGVFEETIVGTS